VQNHDSKIAQAILKTITFFDIFDYPVTLIELSRLLWAPGEQATSIQRIEQELNNPEIKSKIEFSQGFYFLPGKSSNINLRKERYLIAEPKLKKARRFVRYLSRLPGVSGVAISNTLALHHSRSEADIDIFLITKPDKIWSSRFWSLVPLILTGQRPSAKSVQNKYCLSFLVDERHLDISTWKMPRDIYYVYWLATLMPVYDNDIFEKYWQENGWIKDYLPNYYPAQPSHRLEIKKSWLLPLIGYEKFCKAVQMKIMPQNLKDQGNNESSNVVIAEGVLKFHPTDRREQYQKLFDETYKNYQVKSDQ
jgi:lambda repressor-like predicted transcriptional regulator